MLEQLGLVEMVHFDEMPNSISASSTNDALADSFEQTLLQAKDLRQIVLNRVVIDLGDDSLWGRIASTIGISKYEVCSQALDYIYSFYFDKENLPDTNIVLQFPHELRTAVDRDLGSQNQGLVGPTQMLFSLQMS